jgi:tRNA A-37 threonylcarbamoyl transferase component Bud32
MTDLVGQTLAGRYEVIAFLGQGATAHVYKVWDQDRAAYLVAKVLSSSAARYADFWDRFRLEAKTLAQLQHPHIVPFYSFENDDSLTFMLLGYVDGSDLRVRIAGLGGQPMHGAAVLNIMRPLCTALNYAHHMDVIHCDVKPSNLLVSRGGDLFVTDFGIARVARAASIEMPTGGTPPYMAPEQVLEDSLLPQTDVYALGVILYEMVTGGARPFTGEHGPTRSNQGERIRWEQVNQPAPPPRQINPLVTPEIDEIVLRCLAKQPAQRYQSCIDLLNALERTLSAPSPRPAYAPGPAPHAPQPPQPKPIAAPPPVEVGRRPHTPVGVWVAVSILVLAALGVGLLSTPHGTDQPVATPRLAPTAPLLVPTVLPSAPTTAAVTQAQLPGLPVTHAVHKCMSVFVMVWSATSTECVTGVTILPDGRLRLDFSWSLQSNQSVQFQKLPDTTNPNMFVTDNLGHRLDHVEVGGAAARVVMLISGNTQTGSFTFPAPDPRAISFVFHDDDNHIQTEPFSLSP